VAQRWQLTRDEQDAFATASQNKAEAAQKAGRFKDEIVPYTIASRKGDVVVDNDEYIRAGTTIDAVAKLKPAFSKDGTVTAANASGINDGAAALVLMTAEEAQKRGLTPLARIASWATAGVDPAIMGTGPIPPPARPWRRPAGRSGPRSRGGQRGLRGPGARGQQGHGLEPRHRERERRRHRHRPPDRRVGARVLVTLLHEMATRNAKKGLATLCIGGGMGVAMCLER
jgi:acetyl-CoA C-acetyltransferase